jgi:hypothetical protein
VRLINLDAAKNVVNSIMPLDLVNYLKTPTHSSKDSNPPPTRTQTLSLSIMILQNRVALLSPYLNV